MRQALLLLSWGVVSSSFGQTVRSNGGSGLEVSWLQGGHSQGISAITFSPDGQLLVTGANNGIPTDSTIKVWSATDGTLLLTLRDDPSQSGLQEAIATLDFSPDGSFVASGETDGRVSIWDASSWTLKARFFASGTLVNFWPTVLSIRFSSDGKLLAGASTRLLSEFPLRTAGIVDIWSVGDWSLLRTLQPQGLSVYSVSFHPDSVQLAAAAGELEYVIWNAQDGSILQRISTSEATERVAFSPTGLTLATSSISGLFQLWDPSTWQPTFTLADHGDWYSSLSYSADGTEISGAARNNNLRVWDTSSGELIQAISGFRDGPASAALSPDGTFLATGGAQNYPDIQFASVSEGTIFLTLNQLVTELPSAAISSDGALVAVGETTFFQFGSRPYPIHLFQAKDGAPAGQLEGHTSAVFSLAANPVDANLLASASGDRSVRIWDLQAQQTVRSLLGHTASVNGVAYSPDGRLIASASSDRSIKLWDADTGDELNTLTGHTNPVKSVAFSPDGSTLASGSFDYTVKLWNIKTGEPIHTLGGHTGTVNAVAFSPDGAVLASGSTDNSIKFWDPATGQEIRTLAGHTRPVRDIGFSPDGGLFFSASDDRSIKLWNACTGDPVQTVLDEMGNGADAIALSPDGQSLFYARKDGTLVAAIYDALGCEP